MTDTKLTKTIGEHWVCATLARHGWAPALTRDGLERTDLLAVGTHLAHRPVIEVQVKVATQGTRAASWIVNTKAQSLARSLHEWFVFVLLPTWPASPRAFVVPRDHVSAATWIVHQDWRTDPTVQPGKRNADLNYARIRVDIWQGYEDGWDLLDGPTIDAPVRLPTWLRKLAQDERVGLPSAHPWKQALPDW